jgi:hypothetical protein
MNSSQSFDLQLEKGFIWSFISFGAQVEQMWIPLSGQVQKAEGTQSALMVAA